MLIGLLLAGAIATSVVGTALNVVGNRRQTAAMQDAENNRRKQQQLESSRQRRQAVRESLRARAMATTAAYGQGAGGGSGLQGGYGQIAGQANRGILGINQNDSIGANIFAANARAGAAASLANTGAGLSSLGGQIISNLGPISRVLGGAP
jgi:hypothetical protein